MHCHLHQSYGHRCVLAIEKQLVTQQLQLTQGSASRYCAIANDYCSLELLMAVFICSQALPNRTQIVQSSDQVCAYYTYFT
jgi:hypothetical protein